MEFAEHVAGGEVHLHTGLHVEDHPFHGRVLPVDGRQDLGPEVLGVGEAERSVVAVHDEAGFGDGLGVILHVVVPGEPGDLPLDGVVGPGDPGEELED